MNLQFIGEPQDVDMKAWNAYFVGLRGKVKGSLDDMLGAYRTLKKIRESFGLQVIASPSEANPDPGALTDSQFQQILELAMMTDVGVRALDEAIAGTRKIAYDSANRDFQIERGPNDDVRIEVRNNRPTVISNATNQPTQIMGTIDGVPRMLGIAPIAWAALAVAGVVVTVSTLYTVNTAMESATVMVQAHTQKTIALKSMELVEQGKATPAEAKALQTATYEAAADLEEARGSAAGKTGLTPDTNKTIRTVAIVAAIGGAIYLISKIVPNREPRVVAA